MINSIPPISNKIRALSRFLLNMILVTLEIFINDSLLFIMVVMMYPINNVRYPDDIVIMLVILNILYRSFII